MKRAAIAASTIVLLVLLWQLTTRPPQYDVASVSSIFPPGEGYHESPGEAPERGRVPILRNRDDGSIIVIVTDVSGTTLGAIPVVLKVVQYDDTPARTNWSNRGFTNAQGIWVANPPGGTYDLVVNCSTPASIQYEPHGRRVKIRGAGTVTATVALRPLDCAVTVHVIDDLGRPAEGVTVITSPGNMRARTGPEGNVHFVGLPRGENVVRLESELADRQWFCTQDSIVTTLQPDVPDIVVLRIIRGATIFLRDSWPVGHAETEYTLHLGSTEFQGYVPPQRRTVQPAASVTRLVVAPGAWRADVQISSANGQSRVVPSFDQRFSLRPGDAYDFDIRWERSSAMVYGQLQGAGGVGVGGMWVTCRTLGPGGALDPTAQCVKTDPDGRFAFGLGSRVKAIVQPMVVGFTAGHYRHIGEPDSPFAEVAAAEGHVVIPLHRGFEICGCVRMFDEGAGQRVRLQRVGSAFAATSEVGVGPDGTVGWFSFRHVRPGPYVLWMDDAERAAHGNVQVNEDGPATVRVDI